MGYFEDIAKAYRDKDNGSLLRLLKIEDATLLNDSYLLRLVEVGGDLGRFAALCKTIANSQADVVVIIVGSNNREHQVQLRPNLCLDASRRNKKVDIFNIDPHFEKAPNYCRFDANLSTERVNVFCSQFCSPLIKLVVGDNCVLSYYKEKVPHLIQNLLDTFEKAWNAFLDATDIILSENSNQHLILIDHVDYQFKGLFLAVTQKHIDQIGSRLAYVGAYFFFTRCWFFLLTHYERQMRKKWLSGSYGLTGEINGINFSRV